MLRQSLLTALLLFAGPSPLIADEGQAVDPGILQKYIDGMFSKTSAEWRSRVSQDETQKICSKYLNEPPPVEAEKIRVREQAAVVFPADGEVIGNWKGGEQVAQSGRGGQFSDEATVVNGGNCYACHQLAPSEVSYGTLGPSLLAYGKVRDFSRDAARLAYAKIYNAQASLPCSKMPRFGHRNFLAEQQIKDVVAYLFAPESPVNK